MYSGHSLKLDVWRGPPNISKVQQCEIVLSFKGALFSFGEDNFNHKRKIIVDWKKEKKQMFRVKWKKILIFEFLLQS